MELSPNTKRFLLLLSGFTVALVLFVRHITTIFSFLAGVLNTLSPFIVGACLAFILSVPMHQFDKLLSTPTKKGKVLLSSGARRLVSHKTNLIAFSSDACDTLGDPYQLEVTRTFCRLLRERDYDLLLDLYHPEDGDHYASLRRRVRSHSIDGSILIASTLTEKDFESLAAPYAPCVYIDTRKLGPMKYAVSVSVDCKAAYTEVFRCLKQIGRSRIAFLARHDRDLFYHFWRRSLPDHGFEFRPEFCAFTEEDTEQARDAALRMLLDPRPPDAIVARTDAQAQGALRAVQMLGLRVPGDVSIVSHGDVIFSRGSDPQLATVSFDYKELGKAAVNALFQMIGNPEAVLDPIVFSEQFFPRGSMG